LHCDEHIAVFPHNLIIIKEQKGRLSESWYGQFSSSYLLTDNIVS